ncbi:MAG: CZB domain-containing protein [Rhodocyclaceae bacterium]|nr:CZB domain-containing protein [Rhodocyclaceae bacterium]MBX3669265.1 CZB domain-containing protein [Rhodocyclaceae bacterium]
MDIDQEILKHLDWIESLVSLMGKQNVSNEEILEVSTHDRCQLGRWLESEDLSAYKDFPDLDALKDSHKAFHRFAGQMVRAVRANDEMQALAAQDGLLAKSREVMDYLAAMQAKCADAGKAPD